MALDSKFPRHPFDLINPDHRWYPGPEALGDKGREKLLPPLVNNIRKDVYAWRESDYQGVSDVSKSLLNYWFKTNHKNID